MVLSQSYFIEAIRVKPTTGSFAIPKYWLGKSVWQNPINRFSVLDTNTVTTADLDALLAFVKANGWGTLPGFRPAFAPYVDVDGDGILTDSDVTQLTDHLREGTSVAEVQYLPYRSLDVQREIADGTIKSFRKLAVLVNAWPMSDYSVFLRTYDGNRLSEVNSNSNAKAQDSVVFIHNSILPPCTSYFSDCTARERYIRFVGRRIRHNEILKMRFAPDYAALPAPL